MAIFGAEDLNRILETSANIVGLDVGVVIPRDLIETQALTYQLKHTDHWYPGTCHAGLAEMDFRIYGDAFFHRCTVRKRSSPETLKRAYYYATTPA